MNEWIAGSLPDWISALGLGTGLYWYQWATINRWRYRHRELLGFLGVSAFNAEFYLKKRDHRMPAQHVCIRLTNRGGYDFELEPKIVLNFEDENNVSLDADLVKWTIDGEPAHTLRSSQTAECMIIGGMRSNIKFSGRDYRVASVTINPTSDSITTITIPNDLSHLVY